jgi:3',5'-cyclic AMP phosphodiesterase CpdA
MSAAIKPLSGARPLSQRTTKMQMQPSLPLIESAAAPFTKDQNELVERLISRVSAPSAPGGFDWTDPEVIEDVVVTHQPAIAIYTNPAGHVVIRQRDDSDEDKYITIAPANIQAVIDRLAEWRDTLLK